MVARLQVDSLAEDLHPGTGWAEVEADGAVNVVGVTASSLGFVEQSLTNTEGPALWLRLTAGQTASVRTFLTNIKH